MNKKSFIFGFVAGIIVTIATLFVIGLIYQRPEESDPIRYLEQPTSYENKKETSFKVIQVLGNAALASEASDKIGKDVVFLGNTVLFLGDKYYNLTIKKN